jgi:hypothetical protein
MVAAKPFTGVRLKRYYNYIGSWFAESVQPDLTRGLFVLRILVAERFDFWVAKVLMQLSLSYMTY